MNIHLEVVFDSGVTKRYCVGMDKNITDEQAMKEAVKQFFNTIENTDFKLNWMNFQDSLTGMWHYIDLRKVSAISQL